MKTSSHLLQLRTASADGETDDVFFENHFHTAKLAHNCVCKHHPHFTTMNTHTRRNFLHSFTGTALASLLHRDASAAANPLAPRAGHHPAKANEQMKVE